MESKPQELEKQVEALKISEDESRPPFDPWLDLKDCLDEFQIDYTSPEFKEEELPDVMIKRAEEDTNLRWFEKDRLKDIAEILKLHRFWEKEPIMLFR